jgi:hypothetical protein
LPPPPICACAGKANDANIATTVATRLIAIVSPAVIHAEATAQHDGGKALQPPSFHFLMNRPADQQLLIVERGAAKYRRHFCWV